jgi:predicted nucleic acid-binding protein
VDASAALVVLDRLETIVQSMDSELYESMRRQALQRIALRDADDWPVLACALALGCPVWTEDADFFGAGVATWTSDRVALYLA